MFTDLEDLDEMIRQWSNIESTLTDRARAIAHASETILPPADDIMSAVQADALRNSLSAMRQHTIDMARYAESYVTKLRHAYNGYTATEQNNAALFNHE